MQLHSTLSPSIQAPSSLSGKPAPLAEQMEGLLLRSVQAAGGLIFFCCGVPQGGCVQWLGMEQLQLQSRVTVEGLGALRGAEAGRGRRR